MMLKAIRICLDLLGTCTIFQVSYGFFTFFISCLEGAVLWAPLAKRCIWMNSTCGGRGMPISMRSQSLCRVFSMWNFDL